MAGDERLLLEREEELEAVGEALDATIAGSGRTVLIEAEAGMGKSSLLRAASAESARLGIRVLRAAGSGHEQSLPFGGVLQLFDRVVGRASTAERNNMLNGPAALASGLLSGAGLPKLPEEEVALSIIHGLYWLTVNLCLPPGGADDATGHPTVLLVDDAHLIDQGTAGYLLYLCRRLPDVPLSVIVAMRPPSAMSPAELAEVRPLADRLLRPGNLSPAAVETLLSHHFPGQRVDPALTTSCMRVTDGNPFLVSALVEELSASGRSPSAGVAERVQRLVPTSVLNATIARLARLGEPATSIARLVSVIGDDADSALVAQMLSLEPAAVSTAAEALASAGIFSRGEPLRFSHALIGSAVETDMSAELRLRMESDAARALAARGAGDGLIASHLLDATRSADQWVVDVLERAAADARARGSASLAGRLLRRALEEPPPAAARARVLGGLAEAEAASRHPDALDHLEQALSLMDDSRSRADLLGSMGRILWAAGSHIDSAACFKRGAEELQGATDPAARELRARAAIAAHQTGSSLHTIDPVLAELDHTAGREEVAGERAIFGLLAAQRALLGASRTEINRFLGRAFTADTRPIELLAEGGMMLTVAGVAFLHADRLDELLTLADRAADHARKDGSILALATASYLKTWAGYFKGQLSEACADAEFAVDARSYGWSMQIGAACAVLTHARVETGDFEGARAALAVADQSSLAWQGAENSLLLVARAHLELATNNPAEAQRHLRESARRDEALAVVARPIAWRVLAVEAALARGNQVGAVATADEELERARKIGVPRTLGMALRVKGLAEGGPAGTAFLEQAVTLLEESESKLELARALVDLGALTARAGHHTEARAHLSRGLEMANAFGAAPMAERALQELAGTGARPRRLAASGPSSLTPAERRVAGLAAGGATNREIAQRLFVSIKAVEYHMGNVLKKLGLSSRDELREALAPPGSEGSGDTTT